MVVGQFGLRPGPVACQILEKPTKKPAPKKLKGKKKRGNRLCVVILNVAVFSGEVKDLVLNRPAA